MSDLAKSKICYLAGTLGQGGAERQLFYAMRSLRQIGADVRVLSLDCGAFWEEPVSRLGVPVTWVGQDASRLKRLVRIIKVLRNERPHIIQSQHFYTNAYASAAALLLNGAGIGALRSNGIFDLSESGRIGGRINLHSPKTLAANSQAAIRYAIANGIGASRLYFLPNVVDTQRFKPAPRPLSEPVMLVAVGRLTREKRFDRFLFILNQLRNSERLNVRGLIVGPTRHDQELRPELERQAAALGLFPDGVEFRGSIADMPSVYQQAAICVLTSDHEGTPNVLLEAMASGLPVVSTNVGGVPEIVRHGETGFLLDPENADAQVAAVGELVRNAELRNRMGNSARVYVEQWHSVHRLPQHLGGLYELALGKPLDNCCKPMVNMAENARPATSITQS